MKQIAAILVVLSMAASAGAAVTQYWRLNDQAGTDVVVATTGTNAQLIGGDDTSDKSVAGPGGTITAALALNGSDDAIDISASSVSFASGTAFSFSIWFKCDTTASQDGIIGTDGASRGFVAHDNTTIRVIRTVTLDYTVPAMGTTWHHLLVTRDASNNCRVFLDGVESVTGAQSLAQVLAPNRIGVRSTAFADMSFAYARVYNSDESANVATLYAEGTAAKNTRWYYQRAFGRYFQPHKFIPLPLALTK